MNRKPHIIARIAKAAGFIIAVGTIGAGIYAGGVEVVGWLRGHEAAAIAEAQHIALVQSHETEIKALAAGQSDIQKKLGEVAGDVKYIRGRLDQFNDCHANGPQQPPDVTVAAKP